GHEREVHGGGADERAGDGPDQRSHAEDERGHDDAQRQQCSETLGNRDEVVARERGGQENASCSVCASTGAAASLGSRRSKWRWRPRKSSTAAPTARR